MTNWLKQSTSTVINFGPFVDKADAVTLKTGLVSALDHASTGIMLSKNGGTLAVRHATVTTTTYDAHGMYRVTLDTTDTGTLGRLWVAYTDAATCLPVWRDFMVLPANTYDSLVGGSDYLDVSVVQWTGTNVATPDTAGYPKVTHKSGTGTGELSLSSGVVAADVTKISGDATAADNLEAILDGTRAKLYLSQLNIESTGNDQAIRAIGSGTGEGILARGGASDGAGITAEGQGSGDGLWATGYNGINAEGDVVDGIGLKTSGGTAGLTVDDLVVEDLVWDADLTGHTDADSAGEALGGAGGGGVDITAIDGDATAAENAKKWFNGTGYNAANSTIGTVTNPVTADLIKLLGSSSAASALYYLMRGKVVGAAVAGTLSTTEMTTNLTETTNDHWKGTQVVLWITGNLAGQARVITGYVGATKKLQYAATTEAPAAGDVFVIQ